MRKLTKQTIKPVVKHVIESDVNVGYYKFYHFTLDTYNGHNSFKGGTAYNISDCYSVVDDSPFDAYALDLVTGDVVDLGTKKTVMTVELRG